MQPSLVSEFDEIYIHNSRKGQLYTYTLCQIAKGCLILPSSVTVWLGLYIILGKHNSRKKASLRVIEHTILEKHIYVVQRKILRKKFTNPI